MSLKASEGFSYPINNTRWPEMPRGGKTWEKWCAARDWDIFEYHIWPYMTHISTRIFSAPESFLHHFFILIFTIPSKGVSLSSPLASPSCVANSAKARCKTWENGSCAELQYRIGFINTLSTVIPCALGFRATNWEPLAIVRSGRIGIPSWLMKCYEFKKSKVAAAELHQKKHFAQCRSSIRSLFFPLSHACHGCRWFQSWDKTLHGQPCELHGPSHRIQPEEKIGIWFS